MSGDKGDGMIGEGDVSWVGGDVESHSTSLAVVEPH